MAEAQEIELPNGRKYRFVDTGLPYVGNVEYPSGGLYLSLWHNNRWVYLDNVPDQETLASFLKAASQLSPLKT